jgi:hypothetical protein
MKLYGRSGGIAPRILYLETGWRYVVSFRSQSLYLRYTWGRMLGGPQNRSERRVGEKYCFSRV